ncbi:hypothetical protein ACFQZE_07040 [Paenibacillus sp. GCM10027627]|uniref:hypothetical protein n=1 Tax=unclassified Paenibacillus TaxID=185978 RepID=UPI0036316B9C
MYGEWITINLGDDIECRVFITCTPSTLPEIKERRAIQKLMNGIPNNMDSEPTIYAEALQKIDEFNYSQNKGTRPDPEQILNELIALISGK